MVCGICGIPGHNRKTCGTSLKGLRSTVPSQDDVWNHRADCDLYTNKRRTAFNGGGEIDHVFEIQLLDAAYLMYRQNERMLTRGRESYEMQKLVNGVSNANVTSFEINRCKKGPFTIAKNQLLRTWDAAQCSGVDDCLFRKDGHRIRNRYTAMSNATWANIKKAVVDAYDIINTDDNMNRVFANETRAQCFQDNLSLVFESLQIE